MSISIIPTLDLVPQKFTFNTKMIAAFDSYYAGDVQKTVCIIFSNWESPRIEKVLTGLHKIEEAYHSGEFYKRELPGILEIMDAPDFINVEIIIVDAFVWLDDEGTPGLGARLYEAINQTIPVIGVAKTNFATVHQNKRQVLRGKSRKPLFVSAIGLDPDQAAEWIKNLPGPFRIPDILKELDLLTKAKS